MYVQDTQDNYQTLTDSLQEITFTDSLQTKLDEMAELALANGAELREVSNSQLHYPLRTGYLHVC